MRRYARSAARLSTLATLMISGTIMTNTTRASDIPADSPIGPALKKAEAAIDAIVAVPKDKRTWENTGGALDDMYAQLEMDSNFIMFLSNVSTSREEREAGQLAEQQFGDWLVDMRQREDLFQALKAYVATNPQLSAERKKFLDDTMRDFRRSGLELPMEQRNKLKELQKETTKIGIEFEKNIRADETRVLLTADELRGAPQSVLDQIKQSDGLYLCDMSYPTYVPLMTYCENETTRHKLWTAYKRRGGRKNVDTLEKMLKLRAQAAALLGYANTADYETEVRMAKNAATVKKFYEELRPLVRKKAEKDYAELQDAKRAATKNPSAVLYPWDYDYYVDQLMRSKYAVDSQKVQEYFPLDRVMDGLFSITQSLYGLKYVDVTADAAKRGRQIWHPDVKLFEVIDVASGKPIGEFYLDLFPRPEDEKYGHAAQWGLQQHKVWADGRVTLPRAALVCNFTKPTADKPSLLTHDEVETFFHEFGHCLHTLLSETELYSVGGTFVARDFVEAPSQMFENWVWDAEVLKTFAKHYKTGEPIPADLVKGMIDARNLGSGMAAERQFYYGLVDLTYHLAPSGEIDTTKTAQELSSQIEMYPAIPEVYFQSAFGHLNGYQAGYYGYQWSLVYACDMFQRFKELGMLNPEAGKYYRQKILSRGGSMDEMDLVRGYLGREPKMDAYLEHLGLSAK